MSTGRERTVIVGGAGFIGSHIIDFLLDDDTTEQVTVLDNFSSGQPWHYEHHKDDARLTIVDGDARDIPETTETFRGHNMIVHLASNPDIAAAVENPAIDFDAGTLITQGVVEAMRQADVPRIIYASGSGVYGDLGELEATEDHGPMIPESTYGASKLAGEALISSYAAMFDRQGFVFRFGNVVGRRQTHGVGFDFTRRLLADPTQLRVLGDGTQSKSYVLVTDVVRALFTVADGDFTTQFTAHNVATGDYVTVREIAELAIEVVGLDPATVDVQYGTTPRGWKGDVPIVRIATDKIRSRGWEPSTGSAGAMRAALEAMLADAKAGLLN